MRMHNSAIAGIFNDVADLLEIKGDNPFRIRAYRNAARTVYSLSQDISELILQGEDLSKLPGIGKDLAYKIKEISTTGHLTALDELQKELPPELIKLMKIAGLGGKRVSAINKTLGVLTVSDLENAALNHKICKLPGFGEKIEKGILEGIKKIHDESGRILLYNAEEIVNRIFFHLKNCPFVNKMVVAGSFRRKKETVRDIDILITGEQPSVIFSQFLKFPEIQRIISHGDTRTTVVLHSGIQVDVRIVVEVSYGAALHYFTGSKAHNIGIRKRGVKLGLKINEYGIYRGSTRIGGENEEEVFKAVNLPFIEPELREDTGEIEAAYDNALPGLITQNQIRGDLHVHTIRTDGHATLEQMIEAARNRNYSYIAITEHSKKMSMTHGLTERDLAEQIETIHLLNENLHDFTVLSGIEVDILEDGTLDLEDSILERLDLTVCSIHSKFNLSRNLQTERVLRAMDNPYFTIFGHPTGRILNKRPPIELDMERIFQKAKKNRKILEVNSNPERMDLNDIYCKMAKEYGVKVVISTDAHSINDYNFMRFGVGQARRGWLGPDEVINTRDIKDLKTILKMSR
ncbi:MAG: DNA polymerase/3'-5' exonuclease PolX [Fibrobacter sp.]|nr:DNA polymerase/3'-5' exonuclease PolX [Fibrobacter sp.]